jgi:hypothetical protein
MKMIESFTILTGCEVLEGKGGKKGRRGDDKTILHYRKSP